MRFGDFECLTCGSHQQRLKGNPITTHGLCLSHRTCTNSSLHRLAAGKGAFLPTDYDFNGEGLLGRVHPAVVENLIHIPALCILLKSSSMNQSPFHD